MGMFDYIRCEVPLPDGWVPAQLQTKDFNCEMVTHVITKEGRLLLARIDSIEEVPKAERPYPDEPDDSILSIAGSLRTHTSLHDSNFHGIVNFYGGEYLNLDGSKPTLVGRAIHDKDGVRDYKTGAPPKYIFHEYNAKFTDGQLVQIDCVAPVDFREQA